ncbi:GL24126 [Drosophila persimilis]|uniref:GL24126 n=1 Tax=Drosophila persimilis TaxID=7234 RepID=B4G3S2_DROPE|nr:GL24126 [Drosophila persimilis]
MDLDQGPPATSQQQPMYPLQPPPKPRRSRQKTNVLHYESLPTAPPAMCGRAEENIFQFPAVASRARNLSASPNFERREAKDLPVCEHGKHTCFFCQPYRADRGTIEPLKTRLNSAIEAMDELTRTYALLEGFLEQKLATIIDNEAGEKEAEQATTSEAAVPKAVPRHPQKTSTTDTEYELEHSLTYLESLMGTEIVPPFKQGKFKRIRERSKSMMDEEINMFMKGERPMKTNSSRPYLLRRQSTYSDNKSKVSKWTKVKAAFKWERANVPPSGSGGAPESNVLVPLNHEVERYLKVPISQAGGSSSADSVISSSSGHFMSDTGGTPGTISSASSMDDLEAGLRQNIRRDSSKSDTRCDSRASNFEVELRKSATDERLDSIKAAAALPTKSSSSKSLRRSKAFSDFEVLPEDHVAEIKSTTSRRQKLPPSPLNLNQVCSDLPQLHSPLKSPKDMVSSQTMPRMRRVHSPGNSSVPSSPSRHSDFFGEFESEDLSSGDFSEPTTPNHLDFKRKQCEFERSSASNRSVKLCSGATGGGSGKRSSDEHSPTQLLHSDLMSTEQLEQNLTPQFKKKLHKWRAKQQSCAGPYATNEPPAASPTARSQSGEVKPKIDWNLWSMGQMKLEGQGLSALPDQKDLPEKFQKKLEQWNRLKCTPGGGINSDNDSLKRSSKHSQSTRRGSDDDRWYKHKPHDKEKLSRLKAIVAPDHTSKKIEVKTSDGEVMKFEGISRKFTRKLYEWEKARGIGPEASTFALLHPGYCPIDVRRINKECNKATAEHSPTLSRSLSLDSVSPNCIRGPAISQHASSLSLNDVDDHLQEIEDSTDALTDHECRAFIRTTPNNLMKATVLNAISDVQSELGRLAELSQKSPLDEACCQETMEERTQEYQEELQGLLESLQCLKLSIQGGTNRYPRDIVPDINITSEDGQQLESSSAYATCDNSSRDQLALTDHSAASPMEHETETSTTTGTLCRSNMGMANANVNANANANVSVTANAAKKKVVRLRKMGSRQNSKTESDSSDADTHSVLETPRRLRRKNFRVKQRSLDDDFRLGSFTTTAPNELDTANATDDAYGIEKPPPSPTARNVHKSQSTPQAAGPPFDMHVNLDGLNKSLSEQYVRQLKESDV